MNTPFFLVDTERIIVNYKKLKKELPVEQIFYATKPNNEEITINTLKNINASFEIVSSLEMKRLLELGVEEKNIICSLPIKKSIEIENLYKLGCRYFVYDDEKEYDKLIKISPKAKKIARLSVTSISDNDIGFGLEISQLKEMILKNKKPDGYTFYLLNHNQWEKKLGIIFSWIQELLNFHDRSQEVTINIGGNYPIASQNDHNVYGKLTKMVNDIKSKCPNVHFIAEPGRSVINDAFSLVTTVIDVRENDVYIDAHSQILKIAPTQVDISEKKKYKRRKVRFYETLCSQYILFEKEIDYEISIGMKLVLKSCGAYSICFSNNFHSTGKPEIVIDK